MVGETVSSLYVINNYFKLRDPEKDPLKHQVPYLPLSSKVISGTQV